MLSVSGRVRLFETLQTVAHQALSMGFSRQEYWSGLPCTPPGDLLNPETEPTSPASPTLTGGVFTTEPPGKPSDILLNNIFQYENCRNLLVGLLALVSLGWEDPLEEEMATKSSVLAWKIPWTEPGGLQSMGLQRVGHE